MRLPLPRLLGIATLLATVASFGCFSVDDEATLVISAPAVIDEGMTTTVVKVRAYASDTTAGVGSVRLEASQGVLEPSSEVTLDDGVASFTLRCAPCIDSVTLSATWASLTASRVMKVEHIPSRFVPDVSDGGGPIAVRDAGRDPDAALCTSDQPRTGPGSSLVVGPLCWWKPDGSIYAVAVDEVPAFNCTWDGKTPHPGYTLPDGGAPYVGCQGEPIDAVLLSSTSPTAVTICGTVELSEPMTEPVYPRAAYEGLKLFGHLTGCCSRYVCLRDPKKIRYRIQMEPTTLVLGIGARTQNYGQSLFGYYDGTTAKPVAIDTKSTRAKRIQLDGKVNPLLIDFGVGPGRREGE